MTVDCKVVGELTLTCDRCAEDLVMPIDVAIALNVKFGQEEEEDDDVRETIFIPAGESALDLSQTIYDYVCLSLPLQRVHPEGGCSQAALKYLFHSQVLFSHFNWIFLRSILPQLIFFFR